MRVISGKYRGRRLQAPEGKGVRPTTDRVKEAMFSVIQFDIPEASVLDLFAGSGALGIEALSRGAKDCIFVENNRRHIDCLKQNLEKVSDPFEIISADFLAALKRLCGRKFDLVFCDPPYDSDYYKKAMTFLIENDMINENGVVVMETKTGMVIEPDLPLKITQTKTYGSTTLLFIKKEKQ